MGGLVLLLSTRKLESVEEAAVAAVAAAADLALIALGEARQTLAGLEWVPCEGAEKADPRRVVIVFRSPWVRSVG